MRYSLYWVKLKMESGLAYTALQRKSHLCLHFFLGIARTQSQFPHSCVCVPRIGPHISCSRIGRSIVGIYKSLRDTWMWKLGLWLRNSFSGNTFFEFSVLVLGSVGINGMTFSLLWEYETFSLLWKNVERYLAYTKYKRNEVLLILIIEFERNEV
jgi:hypothetical protein